MRFSYKCTSCGREYETEDIMYLCPQCEKKNDGRTFNYGILEVVLSPAVIEECKKKDEVCFSDYSPYQIPKWAEDAFPLPSTPLLKNRKLSAPGLENTFFKLDSLLLSGSFKDRASFMVALQALSRGEKKITLASTGNAGAAMSAAGAALGLEINLFVPESAPVNKLKQSILYGANVIPVKGSYDDAFSLSIEYTKRHGGINRNTAYNPMTIEGKKSVAFDLYNQTGGRDIDYIFIPVGDGCIYSGVVKGFKDLMRAGKIRKMPRFICCQAEKSRAISDAFATDEMKAFSASTRADSISVNLPACGRLAVSYIKETASWATLASEDEIKNAQILLASSGILAEPAAAASYACYLKDSEKVRKESGENALSLILITGTGFKDMASFDDFIHISPSISSLDDLQ